MAIARATSVLLVDDDCNVRRVLAQVLSSCGFHVREADDGLDALEKLRDSHTDIVISDLQMPHCDGRELCQLIRAEPLLRRLYVVIITGGELPVRSQLDCDAIFPKPVLIHALVEELERVSAERVSSEAVGA